MKILKAMVGSRTAPPGAGGQERNASLPAPTTRAPRQTLTSSMYRLACHLKCARDSGLVVMIPGHDDRPVELREHLNIAAVGEFGAHEHELAIRIRIRKKSDALAPQRRSLCAILSVGSTGRIRQ
jgi:hypothetical protein